MSLIEDLEQRAAAELPAGAGPGTEGRAEAWAEGDLVEVHCRVDRQGQRRCSYRFGGVRLERSTLQRLLCPEGACDQALAVRARWAAFRGTAEPEPARATQAQPLRVAELVKSVRVHAAGRIVEARPASFECLTPCPTGAHPPLRLRKGGWDVFDGARYLGGGLRGDPKRGAQSPRFEQIADVARWLRQQVANGEARS